ncbi:MAG: 2-oxoglutarate oxidoreductase subunit KorA [Candidatus Moanabacter tarae]|uniref:2-oxoglutarate oxidoreductase subunit KorA n=1 Tax=Candidatus Moanibacter tarae TaxID=2200854 RepID=A0A2Z4AEQ0_9BACT|nr:MAG: 2-oxoglutarate oxidoreductase subunit KorA [Candidatus Moanabacter tarae]|tara:strand:- start:384 stop:2189 length:1806 start_codon:yes stop_codon:yes gene_type:complete
MTKVDFTIAIGGAAGQGIATPGNILARIFARRGLSLNAYNAYQSLIRGGHTFLTIRVSDGPVRCMSDKIDVFIPLNQDTMDRHLRHLKAGAAVLYDGDKLKHGDVEEGVQICSLPLKELIQGNRLAGNTVAIAVTLRMLGIEFEMLEDALTEIFKRKGDEVVNQNVDIARGAYQYAEDNFTQLPYEVPRFEKGKAVLTGNMATAMGGIAAGVKFYAAYPMSPSTGVLQYFADHARKLDIMVRQVEDEIGVMNMVVGAAHAGCRAMCATSGGGFALMTEAIGMSGMLETPIVCVDVQRAGPATGVPTKTEQGDLWQILGAGQGDYPKIVVAPTSIPDLFKTIPELFNLVDKYQCPGLVLSDLLISEGTASVDQDELDFAVKIDRGETIFPNGNNGTENAYGGYNDSTYLRYLNSESGISPRAVPGVPGHIHIAASDEHDEDGVLISDEFTHPHKRRKMVEKRGRKMETAVGDIAPPELVGPEDAAVTLIGFGSTSGVIREAVEKLAGEEAIVASHLPIKWIVPFHSDVVLEVLKKSNRVIIVENNFSGQFARFLKAETGFTAHGHIRKYDGEPFMPHHIVDAVKEQLGGITDYSVPQHEFIV